jgi:shikimate dehydrogenase
MQYSALIGNPTRHSISHMLFPALVEASKMSVFYQHLRMTVQLDALGHSIDAFSTLNYVGLNVTLPYKREVIKHLDMLDPIAEELGAVNTIKLGKKKIGFNTDWAGIANSLIQFGDSGCYTNATATIFGTGGTARAAIYACKQLGVKHINVLYRTPISENTRSLQNQSTSLGIALHPYTEVADLLNNSQLVINASAAGMVGKAPLPFPLENIKGVSLKEKIFIDAVFTPLHTRLFSYFELSGATVIDGLWMMIYQGMKALSIWLDCSLNIDFHELIKIHHLLKNELQKNV